MALYLNFVFLASACVLSHSAGVAEVEYQVAYRALVSARNAAGGPDRIPLAQEAKDDLAAVVR